ncbi:MAG: hypothetical protein EHM72_18565 [Calditrichaeota bacterium]|nr:MAG: hypothetical protein EHM72_18565 [Calditrichota bacterium]
MEEKECKKLKHVDTASCVGPLWYIGWLFTVAFAHLTFGKALLALLVWPYYLGLVLSAPK